MHVAIIQAFKKAGFQSAGAKPTIAFDLGALLGNERAPESEFKTKKQAMLDKARHQLTETERLDPSPRARATLVPRCPGKNRQRKLLIPTFKLF